MTLYCMTEDTVTDLIIALPGNSSVNSPTRNNGSCVVNRRMVQRVNELAGWRSLGNPNRGVSTMEVVFSVRWSVPWLYNASPLVANLE
jgi:hypothetical protein